MTIEGVFVTPAARERVARAIGEVWGHRNNHSWGQAEKPLFRDGADAAIRALIEAGYTIIPPPEGKVS